MEQSGIIMDQSGIGIRQSRVIPHGYALVPGDHELTSVYWFSQGYMTTEGRPWVVDTRAWPDHESTTDRCARSRRPWTRRVPGHVLSGLVAAQAKLPVATAKAVCSVTTDHRSRQLGYEPTMYLVMRRPLCPILVS